MTITARERRESLYAWLLGQRFSEWTAEEIVDVIGYPYDRLSHYRESRCFDDLLALERERLVRRVPRSRPARWVLA